MSRSAASSKIKQLYFTVTNDLTYDQRMHRICTSLSEVGYKVTLVGRKLKDSLPLAQKLFIQKRLRCVFNKGFLFYFEYNVRLFLFLFTKKMDAVCAIDLDTILPCLFVSKMKGIRKIYDAHEYFTELKEVRSRKIVRKFWTLIEKYSVPKYDYYYTVSEGVAAEFKKKYKVNFTVIRNLPLLKPHQPIERKTDLLFFGGAVNEARGFEYLIPALKDLPYKLMICGDGNFMEKLKELIHENNVEDKVILKGMTLPEELRKLSQEATLGIGLAEKEGINQMQALPNKFLEYMHAGLPQIAMNFPEYQKINSQYKIAILLDELEVKEIATTIKKTMEDPALLHEMQINALKAREAFCWQKEEKILINLYKQISS